MCPVLGKGKPEEFERRADDFPGSLDRFFVRWHGRGWIVLPFGSFGRQIHVHPAVLVDLHVAAVGHGEGRVGALVVPDVQATAQARPSTMPKPSSPSRSSVNLRRRGGKAPRTG